MNYINFVFQTLSNPIVLFTLLIIFLVGFIFACLLEGIINYFKKEKVNTKKAYLTIFVYLLIITSIGLYIASRYNNYNIIDYEISQSIRREKYKEEVESFNSKFNPYLGIQNGVNVQELLTVLDENRKPYKDDTSKVPNIVFHNFDNNKTTKIDNYSYVLIGGGIEVNRDYSSQINEMKTSIVDEKKYFVDCEYDQGTLNPEKFIDTIIIVVVPEDVKEVEDNVLLEYMKNYTKNLLDSNEVNNVENSVE